MNGIDIETQAVPTLDRLDDEGVDAVHDASMHIVENVGVQLQHERARRLVDDCGGEVDDDGVATIPRDVVEECLDSAPDQFTLHGRNPDNDVAVGGSSAPVRAPGYGSSHVHTYEDGRRRSTLADYDTLLKLAQVEDVVTCTGYNLCDPADVDRSVKHVDTIERSLLLTDMPVMGSTHGEACARATMDLVGVAVDDPELSVPYVAGLVNSVPPRRFDSTMLGALLAYAERGQPLVVSSFTIAGASGPKSIAASMVQANAENLVGITLAQLVNPGTPVVYGVPSTNVDERYGSLSIGSPESALFASFAARMGRHYGLPSRGGGGLSDAKRVDYQSGFESMFVQTVTAFSGVDFVLNSAGILESYSTISPEKFVLDCEALRYLDRFRDGIAGDGDALPLDLLEAVPPGGHFLEETESDGRPAEGFFRSAVVDKRSHAEWAADGGKSAFESARDRVERHLEAYERPPLDEDVEAALRTRAEELRREAT
jgi:trimethylamine--corrinoid protein Co-methyltransferase